MKKLILISLFILFASASAFAQKSYIVISKEDMKLRLYNAKDEVVDEYPIACGKNFGNKTESGDMKTPEGTFSIKMLIDARSFQHDFGDGKGIIKGAYGPYFFRLKVPNYNDIGIHGTHDPASIGTRCTEGCIRMNNDDIRKLFRKVYKGMKVVITPSAQDVAANN